MPDFRQRLILFKPMRPGVSGYARLQSERGALLAQLNAFLYGGRRATA